MRFILRRTNEQTVARTQKLFGACTQKTIYACPPLLFETTGTKLGAGKEKEAESKTAC